MRPSCLALPDARRSRCASRPAAPRHARTASSRRLGAGPAVRLSTTVLAEIARVTDAGFKEIALTGVHLGSYGRDLVPSSSLVELLRAVRLKADATHDDGSVRLQPDVSFRISSLEPMDCSREIVDLVAAGDCFAPHFHLPLQHASNRVLAAMRRPYTHRVLRVARGRHQKPDAPRVHRVGRHRRLSR